MFFGHTSDHGYNFCDKTPAPTRLVPSIKFVRDIIFNKNEGQEFTHTDSSLLFVKKIIKFF